MTDPKATLMAATSQEAGADLLGPAAIAFTFVAGLALLCVSGMAQATVLHDAAHDQRHAMAFPCH